MKSIILLITVFVVIGFTYRYLLNIETDYMSQLQSNGEKQYFSHIYKNFSLTNTDVQGKVKSEIFSPQTNYAVADKKTIMHTPKMIMHRGKDKPISITADSADVFHETNTTVLQKNVVVTMPDQRNKNIELTTEELTIDNKLQTASTDKRATIEHGKGKMHGTGLEFNPNTQRIKFLNKVSGSYEY